MANADEVKTNANDGTATEATNEVAKEVKEPITLTKDLEAKIIRQVEYYFGDINLPRDKFLKEQLQLDDGWIPLSVLLTFKRLLSLCPDADIIAQALLNSENDLVVVSDDRKKVRRNPENPCPEYNDERRKELTARTVYVKGFPTDSTFESVSAFFEPYGPFEAIQLRTYKDKALNETVFKGSVFVIFKAVDACKAFMEKDDIKLDDTVLIRKWQADYYEEKRKEREERNELRGKNKKDNSQNKEPVKQHNFSKGAVMHMTGFKDSTVRESIKKVVVEIFEKEPAYITFEKGDTEGYLRFADENGAVDFAAKLTDSKFKVDEAEITVRVLEGEEEETFLNDVYKTISKFKRQNNYSNRNKNRKRRGGGGDGGPRSKRDRN